MCGQIATICTVFWAEVKKSKFVFEHDKNMLDIISRQFRSISLMPKLFANAIKRLCHVYWTYLTGGIRFGAVANVPGRNRN